MAKIINSSYNKANRCGFFLLDSRKISLKFLLDIFMKKSVIAIVNKTDDSASYSSYFQQITRDMIDTPIYQVKPSNFQLVEELISFDSSADILFLEISFEESEELILKNINNLEYAVNCDIISNCVVGVDKFESEFSVLIKEIDKECFKQINKKIIDYKQN